MSTGWKYFKNKLPDEKAQCLICDGIYSNKGHFASILKIHLDGKHFAVMEEQMRAKQIAKQNKMEIPYALCVVMFCFIHRAASLSFPHIYTTGTHYEVGYDIGSTFQDKIQDYFSKHPLLHSKFLPWAETPWGENIIQGYIDITQINYPLYINEIEGLADGANVPFLEVFMLCYEREIAALLGEKIQEKEPDDCSDVYINYPNLKQVALGHNEDDSPLVKTHGYFVTAHIVEHIDGVPGQPPKIMEEKFTHFSFPGILPGSAFGFNGHGIVQTVNALYPEEVLINKTGRYILSRALLNAKNMDEVKQTLYNEGYGAAYGVNLNIGILPSSSNNISTPEIWNIEVAPNTQQNHSLLDILKINSSYYHVNKYRRIKVTEDKDKIVSSIHRATRIEEFPAPKAVTDILKILGDTKDKEYPIYRTPRLTDPESTVATALFNLQDRTMAVYKDNPSNSSYGPVFTLPLT